MLQRRYSTHSYSSYVRGNRLCLHVVPSPVEDMIRGCAAQGGPCGGVRKGSCPADRDCPTWSEETSQQENIRSQHTVFSFMEQRGKEHHACHWLKKGKAEPSSLRYCQAAWTLTGGEPASQKSTVCLMRKRTAFGEFNSHTGRSEEAR